MSDIIERLVFLPLVHSLPVGVADVTAEAATEIERLRAEVASTNERWEKSHQIALAIQDERDALRAEVAGLREDAKRYRWLRNDAQSSDWEYIGQQSAAVTDQEIDAALAARKGTT